MMDVVQTQRDLIAQVVAIDMSDAPEEQREYVTLLNAQTDLMMTAEPYGEEAKRALGAAITGENECFVEKDYRDLKSHVREQANTVFTLEKKFQSTCAKSGLTCEPEFTKYQQNFAKTFKDEEPVYYCNGH